MNGINDYHTPVMVNEIIQFLDPQNGDIIIDCTIGGGGHSVEIIKRIIPDGMLIGIDQDDDAVAAASKRLIEYTDNVKIIKGNFLYLKEIAASLNINSVDGIIFDLGVSSFQLNEPERGFSFQYNAVLDMRMDRTQNLTAEKLVNTFNEETLTDIIYRYGEEKWAARIAKFIAAKRKEKAIHKTKDLVDIILSAIPVGARTKNIHPATKTFQAIRIFINNEMESLEKGLDSAVSLLSENGVICVLSYHSLEDRVVKNTFNKYTGKCSCPKNIPICTCNAKKELNILTKKALIPSEDEIRKNPRSRSAKLRSAKKITYI